MYYDYNICFVSDTDRVEIKKKNKKIKNKLGGRILNFNYYFQFQEDPNGFNEDDLII